MAEDLARGVLEMRLVVTAPDYEAALELYRDVLQFTHATPSETFRGPSA